MEKLIKAGFSDFYDKNISIKDYYFYWYYKDHLNFIYNIK